MAAEIESFLNALNPFPSKKAGGPISQEDLTNPLVEKALQYINVYEGSPKPNQTVGYKQFNDFKDHPNIAVPFNDKGDKSTAAGSYQLLKDTWEEQKKKLGLKDFFPENQKKAAIGLLRDTGALDAIKAGDFDTAKKLMATRWASIPGSTIGASTGQFPKVNPQAESILGGSSVDQNDPVNQFVSALGGEGSQTGKKASVEVSAPTEPVLEKTAKKAPKAAPEVEALQAQMDATFGNVPGYKQVQSAVTGAATNLSQFGAATAQNIGKGIEYGSKALGNVVGFAAPEAGQTISEGGQELGKRLFESGVQNAQTAEAINQPYRERNPVANIGGQIAGAVINPVNKILPGAGAEGLVGKTLYGAAQGAGNMLLTMPVMDNNYISGKIEQAGQGLVGGAIGGVISRYVEPLVTKTVNAVRQGFGNLNASNIEQAANKTIQDLKLTPDQVGPGIYADIKQLSKNALATGNTADLTNTVGRYENFKALGIDPLTSWVTRNPVEFTVAKELSKTPIGKPLNEAEQAANRQLITKMNDFGANAAQDAVTADKFARNTMRMVDQVDRDKVKMAYQAFKDSTGKSLEVPLSGVAQDYTKAVKDYGSVIPAELKNKFESLGLSGTTQRKSFNIEEAEQLIKDINRWWPTSPTSENYAVKKEALRSLSRSVQNAIGDAGADLPAGSAAAELAKQARSMASARFKDIENIPLLRAELFKKPTDESISKGLLNASTDEVKATVDYLARKNPAALEQIQNDIMGMVKGHTLGGRSEENAVFSAAKLKKYIADPYLAKNLQTIMPQKYDSLQRLYKAAEDIQFQGTGSFVNNSNTAAAKTIIDNATRGGALNELLATAAGFKIPFAQPVIEGLSNRAQASKAAGLVKETLNPLAPKFAPYQQPIKPGVPGGILLKDLINIRNERQQEQQ